MKPKMSALVASAIRNLREIRGSTSKEIMNYIKMQYNASDANTRKQVTGFGLSSVVQVSTRFVKKTLIDFHLILSSYSFCRYQLPVHH